MGSVMPIFQFDIPFASLLGIVELSCGNSPTPALQTGLIRNLTNWRRDWSSSLGPTHKRNIERCREFKLKAFFAVVFFRFKPLVFWDPAVELPSPPQPADSEDRVQSLRWRECVHLSY